MSIRILISALLIIASLTIGELIRSSSSCVTTFGTLLNFRIVLNAYWMNPANADRAPAMHKPLFQEAKLKIGPYVAAGKVQTFDGATPLFPGLRSLPTPGHTPGHTFYVLESQGEKLVFWGDILHIAAVQLPDPAVTIEFDSDPRAAAAQRARAFADAAQRGYLVAPAHMAFPGVGHLRSDPGRPGYVWVPIAYINDAIETSR